MARKITNLYGTRDIYRLLRKERKHPKVDETTFSRIINSVNKELTAIFLVEGEIPLPYQMGSIELRKHKPRIKIENNKLITDLPVDWKKTLQLWEEDEEAKETKLLVRLNTPMVYKVSYIKRKAKYKNKVFYHFRPMRDFKRALVPKIKYKELDAFKSW